MVLIPSSSYSWLGSISYAKISHCPLKWSILYVFVRFLEGINQNNPDCIAGCMLLEIVSLFLEEKPKSAVWRLE